ncbi:MAG: transposase [Firmicutes bacterium]|nr:transposase [Bacillota bacterium]
MVVEKGRPISSVAKDLGVSQPSLRRWIKDSSEPEDPTAKRLLELEAENRKLKKELHNANDTVEILKKSVAVFVKPQK